MNKNSSEWLRQLPLQTQDPIHARHLEKAATAFLRQGHPDKAIHCLQEAIAIYPDDVTAYTRLGYLLLEQGLLEDALPYCQKGVSVCPDSAELWFNLGTLLLQLQKLPDAVHALKKAITLKPDFTSTYINLGNALHAQGLSEEALTCCQKGVAICTDSAELWYNLGTLLLILQRLPDAIKTFEQAIALKPDFTHAYINLGNAYKKQGLSKEAIHSYKRGIAGCPDHADLWFNLGTILLELRRLSDAVKALEQAITCKPDFADAYMNLGNTFLRLQRPCEAIKQFEQALILKPDHTEAYINLGNALQSQGKAESAIAAYSQAITHNPISPYIYGNRSLAILLGGNLPLGFAEYEWRTKLNQIRHIYEWCNAKPRWCGERYSGKRLLVHDEQGFGDVIQFSRYLPLVKDRGGIVLLSTKAPLLRLFSHFPGIDVLLEHTPKTLAQTSFDLAVPLLSLPHIFGTTLSTIPASVPYLIVEQNDIVVWQKKLTDSAATFRVGLVWAGNPAHKLGHIRDCSLRAMSPLADIPGITFYSLQKGEATKEAATWPQGLQLIDMTDEIKDFADTAAFIMNLDLVIAVDTAVAHLAGALGKPVWTLLPSSGEWRWLLTRKDSPWYPTMRLFRQSIPGDWASVIREVVQELKLLFQRELGSLS